MTASAIDTLLETIGTASPSNHAIVLALRSLVQANAPDASEQVKYGGLFYTRTQPFCGIFAYKAHVSLEFSGGNALADPAGLLTGSGTRRHLKFTDPDAVDAAVIAQFIRDAYSRA